MLRPVDLLHYFAVLRRRWISATIVALTTLAVVAGATLAMPTKYTATTRLFFALEGSESVTDPAQGSSYAEQLMRSYADVATSPLVLDPVSERLNLDRSATDLAEDVTATVPRRTLILEISVTDQDAQLATAIANAVGAEVAEAAADVSPERADGTKAVEATILEAARVPTDPSSPNVPRNLALGAFLGILLGLAVGLFRNSRQEIGSHSAGDKPTAPSHIEPKQAPPSPKPAPKPTRTAVPKRALVEVSTDRRSARGKVGTEPVVSGGGGNGRASGCPQGDADWTVTDHRASDLRLAQAGSGWLRQELSSFDHYWSTP